MIKKLLEKNKYFPVITAVFVCSLLFSACSKDQAQSPVSAPSPKVAVVRPKPVLSQISSAVRLPPPVVNRFDFSNKKDPFKPFIDAKSEQKVSPVLRRNALRDSLPIHSFDVNQFKLIGVIVSGRQNQAMVIDPGGKGYVLKTGMLIGKNAGKVVSITTNGIEVLEQFTDDSGRVRKEKILLTLPRKQ